ncbi:MAG: hypothetical protein R8M38_04790 [Mariprofundaceae bacterium]
MTTVATLPGIFPLHEDKPFLSEREWTCLRLICHNAKTIADTEAVALSEATAAQIDESRADLLIRTARIARLSGLGTWIARLMAEVGMDADMVCKQPAQSIMDAVNAKVGYPICNSATVHALDMLQQQWTACE